MRTGGTTMTAEIGRCGDCRHWGDEEQWGAHRRCRKADGPDETVVYIYAPHAEDGPHFMTVADFGCRLFEPGEAI